MNSRTKGKRGELEWVHVLRDMFGISARRGQQYSGSPDSPDVVGGFRGTHCEVKRVERLNIDSAIGQAVSDCGEDIPYVAHRRNRKDWLVTIRASDLVAFSQAVVTTIESDG
jgi:Holliday junction resolvase